MKLAEQAVCYIINKIGLTINISINILFSYNFNDSV